MNYTNFPFVHKIDNSLDFPAAEVLENNNRMLAGILREYPLEERRAGAEDDFVGTHGRFGAYKSNIYEGFGLEESIESRQDVCLMVVPS